LPKMFEAGVIYTWEPSECRREWVKAQENLTFILSDGIPS
jgi:hypothetical protein